VLKGPRGRVLIGPVGIESISGAIRIKKTSAYQIR